MIQSKILVFSNDTEFGQSIRTEPGSDGVSKDRLMKYRMVASTSQIKSVENADLLIYDLDLAGGDFERVTEDILHLKLNARAKPLVVLGNRDSLDDALRSTKLRPLIARSVPKPVLPSKLRLVLDATLPEKAAAPTAEKHTRPLMQIFGYGSAVVASIFAMVMFVGSTNANLGSNERPDNTIDLPMMTSVDEQLLEVPFSGIDSLSQKAKTALDQGRMAFPVNDSALYYFDQILKIDLYHDAAYSGRQKVLQHLRDSLASSLEEKQLAHARDVIEVLINAEPFSDDNRRMIVALHQAGGVYAVGETVSKEAGVEAEVVKSAKADNTQKIASVEQQRIKEIYKAIESDNLTPPNAGNAYTLLRSAVSRQEISGDNLRAAKKRLAAELIKRAELSITQSNLALAMDLSKLVSRVDWQHPQLRGLVTSIQTAQSREQQKLKATQVASIKAASLPAALDLKPGKVLKRANPKYPQLALNGNVEGWVEVGYQVNQAGEAVNVHIVRSEPQKVFNKASIRAIKKWRFEPAKDSRTGKAVLSEVSTTRFSFNLDA